MEKYNSISVIIPTYNSGNLILEALNSICNQVVNENIVIEILIVDDGSTDNTKNIVLQYKNNISKETKNIKIRYFYKKNGGVASARNMGILKSKYNLIAFLDADDIWSKDKLKLQINKFCNNEQLGMVFGSFINKIFYSNNKYYQKLMKSNVKDGYIYNELIKGNFVGTSSVIIKRSVLDDVGIFNEKLMLAEDFDLWIRISKKYKIGYIDKPLFLRRYDGKTNLSGGRNEKMNKYTRKVLLENMKKFNEPKIYIEKALKYLDMALIYDYICEGKKTKALETLFNFIKNNRMIHKRIVIYFILILFPKRIVDNLLICYYRIMYKLSRTNSAF